MNVLAPLQHRVLATIIAGIERDGFPPTIREMGDALGYQNLRAIEVALIGLESKRYIVRLNGAARAIRVIRDLEGHPVRLTFRRVTPDG